MRAAPRGELTRQRPNCRYGNVIHEFDPWFNYRATEYLADHGWQAFFTWFDHRSWYPLGRPVGTTIYPGMQITSVAIWRVLSALGSDMSLNDVCVYVPVWFGVAATLLLGLLTFECGRSANAAVGAALVMSVIPAHLMRSVGGGYDNESVAMAAMVLVFWHRAASWAVCAQARPRAPGAGVVRSETKHPGLWAQPQAWPM